MKTFTTQFIHMIMMACLPFMLACNSDDDNSISPVEQELQQLKNAVMQYQDFALAEADGFIDVSGFVPNMGHHFLHPQRFDNQFVLLEPEILLYNPTANGTWELLGVEYAVPVEDLENPGTPPQGFTGTEDTWTLNTALSQWQLHVWLFKDNPDGIFNEHNSQVTPQN